MPWKIIFSARLRQSREQHGWNKKQLGDRASITNVFILELEKGRKVPSVDTLVALARALDVPTDWLLGLSDQDPQGGNTHD